MNQIHGFSISVYFMVLIDDLKFGYHTIHRHKNIQLKKSKSTDYQDIIDTSVKQQCQLAYKDTTLAGWS